MALAVSLLLQHVSISQAAAVPSAASTKWQTVFSWNGLPDDAEHKVENTFGGNETEQSWGVYNKPLEEQLARPVRESSHDRD